MKEFRQKHWLGMLIISGLLATMAWAEQMEIVTYYPTPVALPDPLYVNSAGIGAGYRNLAVPTNGLAVEGRVGFGTRTPSALLDIRAPAGTNVELLRIIGPDDARGKILLAPGADTAVAGGPSLDVGIGTTNPVLGSALDIFRDYDAAYVRVRSTGVGDPDNYEAMELYADLGIVGSTIDDRIWQMAHKRTATNLNDFFISYRDNTGVWYNPFVITRALNVGIKTTTPSTDLAFGGDSPRTIQMERHTAANTAGNGLLLRAGGATAAATDKSGGDMLLSSGISTGLGSSGIYFLTATGGGSGNADRFPNTKMIITGNGDVGIGYSNANNITTSLDVYRTSVSGLRIFGGGDGNNFAQIDLRSDEGTSKLWQIAHKQSGINKFQIAYNDPGTGWIFPFTITPGGNVGINQATPTERLYVVGNLRVDGNIYYTGTIGPPSDLRLKTNIQPLANALERLEAIRGVSFEWNDLYERLGYGKAGQRQIGVVAQEVEKIFPEAVFTSDGYKGVDYNKLTPILIEAIKELKSENDQLKEKTEALEQKVRQMEEQLTSSDR